MQTLKMTATPTKSGRISICVPPNLRSRKLEVVVVFNEQSAEDKNQREKKYDFSNIAGKLHWKGNPVKEQRRLRNEW